MDRSQLRGWNTQDLLVTAIIGIVVGLLLLPVNILDVWLRSLGVLFTPSAYGLWAIPGILVAYIVRRPGAAFLALVISGVVQAPLNPYGWLIVITQSMAGVMCELAFLVTRYRNFKLLLLMMSGIVMALFTHLTTYPVYGIANFTIGLQILMAGLAILSGVLAGWVSKTIVDAIAKSGVLNNFAIGQEVSKEV